jgi:putative hemolysin
MSDEIEVFSIVALGVLLLISAFFSGAEAALLSVQRVRIRHLADSGSVRAARVARMVEHPERLLPPILLGNNLANTAAAAIGTVIAISLLNSERQAVLVATIAATAFILVFGETIPKTLGTRHAERVSLAVALPLQWIGWLMFPAVLVLQQISRAVTRMFRAPNSLGAVVTEEEIKTMVTVGREAGTVERGEEEMIRRVFEFGERRVREVMTPRPEIVWVEQGTTFREFLAIYNDHYHARFPVFDTKMDNVVGFLSVKDVLRSQVHGELPLDDSVTTIMRTPYFVPETKLVAELFEEMRALGHQMAMSADEFGGVAGLVTLNQLVEEVVGPVGQEGEAPEEEVVALSENVFELDAGIQVQEANERLDLDLPEGEYETVAGFILERLGRVPQEQEQFTYGRLHFRILEMRGVKIERVLVNRPLIAPEE